MEKNGGVLMCVLIFLVNRQTPFFKNYHWRWNMISGCFKK